MICAGCVGVEAIVPPSGVVDADAPADAPELFLLITRRSPRNEAAEEVSTRTAFEQVDSSVMNLGRLDVLSPREQLREADGA